jgi:hypothetical protein
LIRLYLSIEILTEFINVDRDAEGREVSLSVINEGRGRIEIKR